MEVLITEVRMGAGQATEVLRNFGVRISRGELRKHFLNDEEPRLETVVARGPVSCGSQLVERRPVKQTEGDVSTQGT